MQAKRAVTFPKYHLILEHYIKIRAASLFIPVCSISFYTFVYILVQVLRNFAWISIKHIFCDEQVLKIPLLNFKVVVLLVLCSWRLFNLLNWTEVLSFDWIIWQWSDRIQKICRKVLFNFHLLQDLYLLKYCLDFSLTWWINFCKHLNILAEICVWTASGLT